jgi:hypothetical protein
MTSISLSAAERKKRELDARRQEREIEKAAKGAIAKKWTRKCISLDDEILDAMSVICQRERKMFSQLAREFFLAGLAGKGVALD